MLKRDNRRNKNYSLSPKVKERILQLAGEFKTPRQICLIVKEEFPNEPIFKKHTELNFTKKISELINRNRELVISLKEEYCRAILEVPIAHKRIRLERLEELYWKSLEENKIDEAQKVLSKAREELEGVRVNLNMYQLNFFGRMSDEELAEREREIVERIRSLAGGEEEEKEAEGVSVLPASREAEVVSPVSSKD